MGETQKCLKCKRMFARYERTGPSPNWMGDAARRTDVKTCPSCGGRVVWVDDDGLPLSDLERMDDAKRHLMLGCLWGVVSLVGFLLVYHFAFD